MIKNTAVIFCGHGSSNKNYKKNFRRLISKFKLSFSNCDVFDCYIEIDSPNIQECIEQVSLYSKIIFFPLFIFDGKHYQEDVKNRIKELNKEIIFVNKISLENEIFQLIKNDILSYKTVGITYFVTSCSISLKKSVHEKLSEYTTKIANALEFSDYYFCQYGDEEKTIIELKKCLKYKPGKVILHPIYLFRGYLYKKVTTKFLNMIDDLKVMKPISEYEEFFYILKNKLLNIK
tara:strand:+ start:1187 stop:1885 length:699 start_codon:yes stop_codon:yes gene_type:complete